MTIKARFGVNRRITQFSTGSLSNPGKRSSAQNLVVHGLSTALQAVGLDSKQKGLAQDIQTSGCSLAQSVTIAVAMKDLARRKTFKNIIETVRYRRLCALAQFRNVLKSLSVVVMTLFLQSCFPFGLYQNAYNAGADYFNPKPFIISDAIKSSPYAMQLVRYKNSNALMVLAYVDDGSKLSWVDSEGNGFTTLGGKIIASHGLDNDLEIINPPKVKDIFLSLIDGDFKQSTLNSLLRLSNPPTDYLEMQHTFKIVKKKPQMIKKQINQAEVSVNLIEEQIYVPAIRWEASNFYWVDEKGNVVKSKQVIAPNTEKYFLESLKEFKPTN